ncbi:hypothetical protein TNCV_919701 [Trichonephila clavipes]|nr:hypothetical protein TNCV_919701 [Trichonephila clavipes]
MLLGGNIPRSCVSRDRLSGSGGFYGEMGYFVDVAFLIARSVGNFLQLPFYYRRWGFVTPIVTAEFGIGAGVVISLQGVVFRAVPGIRFASFF